MLRNSRNALTHVRDANIVNLHPLLPAHVGKPPKCV
jgi:hypothetical protein